MNKLKSRKEIWLFALLILLCLAISSRSAIFFTFSNFKDVFMINSVLGVVALGMMMCIITGGIDISVSGNMAVSLVIAGNLVAYAGASIWVALLVCSICCTLIGAINGVLIAVFEIPPIVATLGMLSMLNGAILIITQGAWINTSSFPTSFMLFSRSTIGKIPIQIIFWVIAIFLAAFILRFTLVGRSVYAIGGNRISAKRSGVNIKGTLIFVYAFNGFLCAVAGILYMTIVQQVDPATFSGFEMTVVTAVVVGGANMSGGSGSILGTVLGVIFIVLTNNGLVLARIPTFWQKIVVGFILLAAVTFEVLRRKNVEKRLPKIDVIE